MKNEKNKKIKKYLKNGRNIINIYFSMKIFQILYYQFFINHF